MFSDFVKEKFEELFPKRSIRWTENWLESTIDVCICEWLENSKITWQVDSLGLEKYLRILPRSLLKTIIAENRETANSLRLHKCAKSEDISIPISKLAYEVWKFGPKKNNIPWILFQINPMFHKTSTFGKDGCRGLLMNNLHMHGNIYTFVWMVDLKWNVFKKSQNKFPNGCQLAFDPEFNVKNDTKTQTEETAERIYVCSTVRLFVSNLRSAICWRSGRQKLIS